MVICVNDFSLAAHKLGNETPQRLREDGRGIATSKWELFKVSFFDLFRNEQQITDKKTKALEAFLSAISNEYGEQLGETCRHSVTSADAASSRCLMGHTIQATVALIKNHGGANWLHNEIAINLAAHASSATEISASPTLSMIVASECSICLEEARANQIPEVYLNFILLCQQYSLKKSPSIKIQVLSDLIENALRKASKHVNPDGTYQLVLLKPDEIVRIARLAVHQEFIGKINGATYKDYAAENPFVDDLVAKAQRRGFTESSIAIFSRADTAALLRQKEKYAVANAPEILSKTKMEDLRNAVITNSLDIRKQNLELIDRPGISEGRFKDDMIELCIQNPSPMSAQYFDQLSQAAADIAALDDALSEPSSPEQYERLLTLGSQLVSAANLAGTANGPDDIGRFIALSVDLLAATSSSERMSGIEDWMKSETAKKLRGKIAWTVLDDDQAPPEAKASASHLNYLFANLSRLAVNPASEIDPG